MLADALLTEQKHEVVVRAVAVQAQPLDGECGARQVQRLAPGTRGIQADQHRLLALALDRGEQQALAVDAMVQSFEAPGVARQAVTGGVQQLQALVIDLHTVGAGPGGVAV